MSTGTGIFIADHYAIRQITTMDEVRAFWKDEPQPDAMNWMFGSTGGVHGSGIWLDQIEECLTNQCDCPDSEKRELEHQRQTFTVLICLPRLVKLVYGHVAVTLDDIPYLRTVITRSLAAIRDSQAGNLEATAAAPGEAAEGE